MVTHALAAALLAALLAWVLAPMLADFSTYGFHDWDVATAYRYITVLSLRNGEGPWWHPYLCGGVQAFGYSEGATNFVSPFLPLYLLFDLRAALRLEVVAQGLLALSGSYLLAGCFTSSVALRAFVAALFVLNGRWALQAAVGHTWHLQYSLLPWAFFCFERALGGRSLRWAAGAGICLALECYWGGVYPLPHTALFLSLLALFRAGLERRARPLWALAVAGTTAIGLSAPKLFAALDQLRTLPRLIELTEVIGPRDLFSMLTLEDQRFGTRPVPVPAYNWHEWGIYVGPVGVVALVVGLTWTREARGRSYALLGAVALLLGFGAFHPLAPWTLLHRLPLFASQHVPSRFHYPMLLFLGLGFVLGVQKALERRLAVRPLLDLALLLPVALFGWDMARFSRTPFEQAFWMRAPQNIEVAVPFVHRRHSPVSYVVRDWAEPVLLAMFANTGVISCYGVDPAFHGAAVPIDSSRYRGLAYVDEGPGRVEVTRWTPNSVTLAVEGAPAGALVVYDMNYDPGWRADGSPALDHAGLVAARLPPGGRTLTFRYAPRTLTWSVPLALLTLSGIFAPWSRLVARVERARRRA